MIRPPAAARGRDRPPIRSATATGRPAPPPSLAEQWVDLPHAVAPALAALMRSEIWDRVEQKVHCLRAISRAEVGAK